MCPTSYALLTTYRFRMSLRTLPLAKIKKGTRVLMRVDWNVPIKGTTVVESEKIERTCSFIRSLHERGAIVLLMTHLGRPKGRDTAFSTKMLTPYADACVGLPVSFLDVDLSNAKGVKDLQTSVSRFKPGDIALFENVRFQPGEEENSKALAKKYASVGDIFINDAFASCHRSHVSVVGIAGELKSYAGPNLLAEVNGLSRVLGKVEHPYYAFIGGSKLSTKMPVIRQLLKIADKVFIGGAMAHPFFVAKRMSVGKSLIEKEGVKIAKTLLKEKKIVLPTDAIVAKNLSLPESARCSLIKDIKASESIGDIGTQTSQAWAEAVRDANTIVWNGPVGMSEISVFSHGSAVLAKAIAMRANGKAYAVIGGGDTIPVIQKTGMADMVSWISTGGGAMLEFLEKNGKLPGLKPLQEKKKVDS